MSLDDTLAAIDAATGCQWCGGPLGTSPSLDFCGGEHQAAWHAARTEPLRGYVDPWRRPWDFPGVGEDEARSNAAEDDYVHTAISGAVQPANLVGVIAEVIATALRRRSEFRLPPMTSDLTADERAANRAYWLSRTAQQRRAVALRREMLRERRQDPVFMVRRAAADGQWQVLLRDSDGQYRIPHSGDHRSAVGIDLGAAAGVVTLAWVGSLNPPSRLRFFANDVTVGECSPHVEPTAAGESAAETQRQRALRLMRERNRGPAREPHTHRGRR